MSYVTTSTPKLMTQVRSYFNIQHCEYCQYRRYYIKVSIITLIGVVSRNASRFDQMVGYVSIGQLDYMTVIPTLCSNCTTVVR